MQGMENMSLFRQKSCLFARGGPPLGTRGHPWVPPGARGRRRIDFRSILGSSRESEGHPGPPFRMPGGDRNAQRGIEKAESMRRVATAPEAGLPGRDQTPRDPVNVMKTLVGMGPQQGGRYHEFARKRAPRAPQMELLGGGLGTRGLERRVQGGLGPSLDPLRSYTGYW